MSRKKGQDFHQGNTDTIQLEARVMHVVTKFLEQKTNEGMDEEDKVSIVVTAFTELTVTWTKFIAKMEAMAMFETGGAPNYEAEQTILVMLAELGDRKGLDFGRFLTLTKGDDGVWQSPKGQGNSNQ